MKRTLITVAVMAVFLMTGANAMADPVKTIEDGCKVELEKYCAMVTPGDGRQLASGTVFLLPYYMGLYHGFIRETE